MPSVNSRSWIAGNSGKQQRVCHVQRIAAAVWPRKASSRAHCAATFTFKPQALGSWALLWHITYRKVCLRSPLGAPALLRVAL